MKALHLDKCEEKALILQNQIYMDAKLKVNVKQVKKCLGQCRKEQIEALDLKE